MLKKQRKNYDVNFKKEAVSLVEQEGYSLSEAATRFGVSKSTMASWKKNFGHTSKERPNATTSSLSLYDQKQLEKELLNVRRERDILKKALAYFAANPPQ